MRKVVLSIGVALAAGFCARPSVAQVIDPLPPSDCPGPDFFWPGHGYVPLGSVHDGLVVSIHEAFRYSGGDNDQDWNFVIRPIDRATCPDGQELFGRDCAQQRQQFIDVFWNAATMDWQFNAAYALAQFGERSTLIASERHIADQLAAGAASVDLGPAEVLHVAKKMWAAIQLDPAKFAAFSTLHQVEAEVQIDDQDPDDEGQDILDLEGVANLANCPDGGGKLCSVPALMYGVAVADTKHEDGKPELHPMRALVTQESLFGDSASYKVRVFSDYGKASGAGGGSLSGRICENWYDNTYNGGHYLSYVSIRPETFVIPGNTGPAHVNGSGGIREPSCRITPLDVRMWNGSDQGLVNFAVYEYDFLQSVANRDLSSCPTFIANPMYRPADEQHRVWGGWGVARVDVRMDFKGVAKHWITTGKPVSLGVKTPADTIGDRKAPYAAHWWKVQVASHATLAGKDLTFKELAWNVPGPAFVVRPNPFSKDADVYIGVDSVGNPPHSKYEVNVSAKLMMWTKEILDSTPFDVSVPHPSVSAKGSSYAFDVVTSNGKKSLIYKITLQAKSKQFATTPKYSWWKHTPMPEPHVGVSPMPGKLFGGKLGEAAQITLAIPDSDKSTYELRAQDAYEKANVSLELNLPRATVDAPTELQVKGGQSVSGKITKITGGGGGAQLCIDTATQPVTFHSTVKLVAKMFAPQNPYNVPIPTAPQYQWGKVEKRVSLLDKWQVYPSVAISSSSGNNQDTLTVTIGSLATDDFSQLSEFRVAFSATEDYGRSASTTIYFNNWEAAGLLTQAQNCMNIKATQVSAIPPWQWGIIDPLRTPYDPARDAGIAMRDPAVLAHANLFLNPAAQKGTFAPLRAQVAPSGATHVDMSKLVARGAPRTEQIAGAAVDPRAYGLRNSHKLFSDFAAHLQITNIRSVAPLLGPTRAR